VRVLRSPLALLFVVAVTWAFVPSSAVASEPGSLPDGFTVASGSRLLGGTVFPYNRDQGFRGVNGGWTGVLEVSGPAAAVYDAYAAQARALGVPMDWSDEVCSTYGEANVRCAALARSGSAEVSIDLRVCAECSPVTAMALINAEYMGDAGEAVAGSPPAVRKPQFEVQIAPAQLRAGPMPTVGEQVGRGRPTRVIKGSKTLGTGDVYGCGSGSHNALFKVTGDPRSVYRRYVAQLPEEDDAPLPIRKGRLNGHEAFQAGNVYGSVLMAEGSDGPVIAVLRCNDD
jgi:hypothetical protein